MRPGPLVLSLLIASAAWAFEPDSPLDDAVARLKRTEPKASAKLLKDRLTQPKPWLDPEHVEALWLVYDAPSLADYGQKLLAAHEDNPYAAEQLARALMFLGRPADAVKVFDKAIPFAQSGGPYGEHVYRYSFLPMRCEAAWLAKLKERIGDACSRAMDSPFSSGYRYLALNNLASGRPDSAVTTADKAVRAWPYSGENLYVYALAKLSEPEQNKVAVKALIAAVSVWPDYTPAWKLLDDPGGRVDHQIEEMHRYRRHWYAAHLADCGRAYLALGLPERADRCFAAAEAVEPGAAEAGRLLWAISSKQKGVLELAKGMLEKHRHPVTLSVASWLTVGAGDQQGGMKLLSEALAADPADPVVVRIHGALCAGKKNAAPPCDRDLSVRARPSTDKGELQRMPKVNIDSRFLDRPPPPVDEFVVLPVSARPLPELNGLVEAMAKKFPGKRFRLEKPLKPTKSAFNKNGQLIVDRAFEQFPKRPGILGVTDEDIVNEYGNWGFSEVVLEKGYTLVSLNRLRNPSTPARSDPADPLLDSMIDNGKRRLRTQTMNNVGKLLGLSFPCRETACTMTAAHTLPLQDQRSERFCLKHQRELDEKLKSPDAGSH